MTLLWNSTWRRFSLFSLAVLMDSPHLQKETVDHWLCSVSGSNQLAKTLRVCGLDLTNVVRSTVLEREAGLMMVIVRHKKAHKHHVLCIHRTPVPSFTMKTELYCSSQYPSLALVLGTGSSLPRAHRIQGSVSSRTAYFTCRYFRCSSETLNSS